MPEGCGERTGNLFDGNYELAYMAGSAYAQYYSGISNVRTAVIPCKANTKYSIKRYVGGNRLRVASYTAKPTNNMTGTLLFDQNSATSTTVTTPANAEYLAVYVAEVTSATEVITTGIFEGETIPSTYIPYGYKITISSNSTTTPVYLGEVETTRRIKKLVLTGQENWGAGTENFYIFVTSQGVPYSSAICTHAKNSSINNNGTALWMKKADFPDTPTVADFKSYLAAQYAAGTPVTIWYVLATPETAVVNEPLMKIGDYVDSLSRAKTGIDIPTVVGQNALDVLTTVKPSSMRIEYTSADETRSRSKRISLLKSPLKKGLIK
jgi:hypothetical protein